MIYLKLSLDDKELNDYVLDQEVITLGSDPDNDVCLNGQGVNPHHAKISFSTLQLNDLGGGTSVNKDKVQSAILENGDVIGIGPYLIRFYHSKPTADGSSCDTRTWKVTVKGQPRSGSANADVPTWKVPKTIKL